MGDVARAIKNKMKTKLRALLAFTLYYSGLEHLLSKLISPKGSFIFMYHSVGNADFIPKEANFTLKPNKFEAQIRYLTKRFKILPLADLVKNIENGNGQSGRYAAVTFDDGYKDNFRIAWPILSRYGVPATIFLTTKYIDEGDWIDLNKLYFRLWQTKTKEISFSLGEPAEIVSYPLHTKRQRETAVLKIRSTLKSLSHKERRELLTEITKSLGNSGSPPSGCLDMLSWEEVREMRHKGITFGAHGVTHAILSKLSSQEVRQEIRESKQRIETMAGQPVDFFAYPNGHWEDFNDAIIEMLKEEGYRGACTTVAGSVKGASDPYQLRRIGTGKNVYRLALDLLISSLQD